MLEKASTSETMERFLPPVMALACEAAGTAKAGRDALTLTVLEVPSIEFGTLKEGLKNGKA
jgi:hypothetical protein